MAKKKTLLIRELAEQNLYEGVDYIKPAVVRDMKMVYKHTWYRIVSVKHEKNHRIILVTKQKK